VKQKLVQTLVCENCVHFITQKHSNRPIGYCAVTDKLCHRNQEFCNGFSMDTVLTSEPRDRKPLEFVDNGFEYASI
jgi:hypothetical protein